jgi:predicted DNA-binding transcriptional regulator AlpA
MSEVEIDKIGRLPDCAVLNARQVGKLLGVSAMTLWTLGRDREGPPRVKLSRGRIGYPVGAFKQWLAQREAA